ncbi:MAG: ABC transporter substrate-binding protein [Nocardiopsaceae bacterium]|jgi:branched-chain amino acid transport system substrate-binding protein|nr:ABC transporter substrate-binding protein [Nocardiopsaceae bacterium]
MLRRTYFPAGFATAACAGLLALAVAGCGSSPTSAAGGSGPSGTLTVAMLATFSGPNSYYGQSLQAGCYPAAKEINAAGGILGHKITCKVFDDRGDPADAVPAAYQMLSSTNNVVAVLGPCGDTSTAVDPILEHAKMPAISCSGQDTFDNTTNPYFWRNLPSDGSMGWAMTAYAKQRGYQRIAMIFGNDASAQGSVPGVLRGAHVLGLHIASNLTLTSGSTSYSTEVARVIQSNPQAILTETDPQTAGTFFREMIQTGHFYPVIGTLNVMVTPYLKSVKPVIGTSRLTGQLVGMNPFTPSSQTGFKVWTHQFAAAKSQIPSSAGGTTLQYNESPYDGLMVMALAMEEAHSTKGPVYNKYIMKIFNGSPGAVAVSSYAQGKKLIAEGKAIRWDGAEGLQTLNSFHNTTGNFEVQAATASLSLRVAGSVNSAYLRQVAGGT